MRIKKTSSGHGVSVSPEASQKIQNLGFLCSIFVVVCHAPWPREPTFSLGWFIYHGIAEGLARIAVPFFFVASGFFLARHFGEKGWWLREVGKRLNSLVLPFFVWSLVALLVSLLPFDMSGAHLHFTNFGDWLEIFGLNPAKYPLNYPLWCLRGLFGLVTLSFAIEYAVLRLGRVWLAVAFFVLLICWRLPVGHWHVCLFHVATGLFYFSVGVFLHKAVLPALPPATAVFASLAGLSLLSAKLISVGFGWHFQYELGALSLPFFLVSAWAFVPKSKWPRALTSCAFPIFLMHIPVFWLCDFLLLQAGMGALAGAFIQLAAGVFCPCAIAWLFRRFVPGTASVVFGGR